ncbi:hypothetical protein [Rhodanobacter glycinis]|nr:hypothetical protein [Rhodanobacter glycinis]
MNTFIKYAAMEKYMPALFATLATASIVFGFCWSMHAGAPLHG